MIRRRVDAGTGGAIGKIRPGPKVGLIKMLVPFFSVQGQQCNGFSGGEQVFLFNFQVLGIYKIIDAEVLVRIEEKQFFKKNQGCSGVCRARSRKSIA